MRNIYKLVVSGLLLAPALAGGQGVFHPVCPTTANGSRIVATKMIDTTDDPSTGQRTFRMLYEIRPINGPTSQIRICVGKEPTAVERIPPKLPPQETLAPPAAPPQQPPATTIVNQPPPASPPNRPGRSCWKTGVCELGLLALAAGGTALGVNCARFWCRDHQRQEVNIGVFSVNDRRGKQFGFGISMPFLRP